MYAGMAFMPWRKPKILDGEDSFVNAVDFMAKQNVCRPLIVCDKSALERGALDSFFQRAKGVIGYAVYDGVLPNPTVEQVEQGLAIYLQNNCDSLLAFGGGSAMDCAKAIGARVVRPNKTVNQMKGLLKVNRRLPPFFAVPTTAGTGSECTVAAVITNGATHDKYAINDFSLIPHYAILDPKLTQSLPPFLTATTGMDALTHAVEAYIGRSNTRTTKRQAEQAVKLVFENLAEATTNGNNLNARSNMQCAAYLAGLAFTRAYVGYVHALAHALGGTYGIAHGYANAVLLPRVLQAYGKSAYGRLAKLAKTVGVADKTDSKAVASNKFIEAIDELNKTLSIPVTFEGKIKEKDFDALAKHADREANPLYPVPKLLNAKQLKQIYYKVM
ncbi:MAG: iron-containing alcohol dehydrogenase [Clostridia bacterium]|nr:iron-containing alcohol dehydrogenase [Clostridia bacterium]